LRFRGIQRRLFKPRRRILRNRKRRKFSLTTISDAKSAEAETLRAQNRQLQERIDHLLVDNGQYRRTLKNRATPRG
jgi:hypothetical protein